jgi:hypothetical protein
MSVADMSENKRCFVCGYDLEFEPWRGESASHEFCPCCGIQFGYHDVPEGAGLSGTREEIYQLWRSQWIAAGMPWQGLGIPAPSGWDPRRQLTRAGLAWATANGETRPR